MEIKCFSFGPFVLIPGRQALLRRGSQVRLGARALEILSVLVQRPGAVVEKQELMSMVWADTFVDESNLKVHIAAIRKTLDEDGSQPSCIATVIGRGYRFVEPVLDCAMNGSIRLGEHVNCVPTRSECLFGREDAVQKLASQIEEHRVVTLVGCAGIGKTAVAVAAAEMLTPKYKHGCCRVDLSGLDDPSGVAQAVASAVGVNGALNGLEGQLIDRLRNTEMLMILDTCERAIEAVASFVELVHSSCPKVHVLAVTREIIGASGEQVLRLPPLVTPPPGVRATAAEVQRYPAVQLFLERAEEKLQGREMSDTEAALIAALCEQLDGVPLAIELAAWRFRSLGFAGLPPVFTDDWFSLNHGGRTGPRRHQSLGAALDWSLDLLSENERLVLLKLTSIEGSFDLDQGIVTASDCEISRADTTTCIANLVSKSLVERQGYGKVSFRLLNSVRSYASRNLAAYFERMTPRTGENGLKGRALHHLVRKDRNLPIRSNETNYVMRGGDGALLQFPADDRHRTRATGM